MARNVHGQLCAARFGAEMMPAYVKAPSDEVRSLFRSLRMIVNAAVIAVVRRRQADGLDDISAA